MGNAYSFLSAAIVPRRKAYAMIQPHGAERRDTPLSSDFRYLFPKDGNQWRVYSQK